MKVFALCFAIALSIITGCAPLQKAPNYPKAETDVTGIEIKSLPGFVLVDELEFDSPVTVTRGPCGASSDCLLWTEGTEKFSRPLQADWSVAYRYETTVTIVR